MFLLFWFAMMREGVESYNKGQRLKENCSNSDKLLNVSVFTIHLQHTSKDLQYLYSELC